VKSALARLIFRKTPTRNPPHHVAEVNAGDPVMVFGVVSLMLLLA
jgi:hypothetical protein